MLTMKFLEVALFALVLVHSSCSDILNVSSNAVKDREIFDENINLFPQLNNENLLNNLISSNSSGKCSEDVKSLIKALARFELWALKSNCCDFKKIINKDIST